MNPMRTRQPAPQTAESYRYSNPEEVMFPGPDAPAWRHALAWADLLALLALSRTIDTACRLVRKASR